MGEIYSLIGQSLPAFIDALFSLEMLLALAVGILGGLIIGALPGLNPAAGIALLMPITYNMSPIPALTMLMAIYTAGIMGGSYSAILLHTPGTTSAVATITDGYALTEKGEPLRALTTSTYASTIGGAISAIALLFISPLLAELSLTFDSAEYFLLGIFGISLIASLASDSLLKGCIAGLFGLCLSCVGQFPLESTYRYTFGIKHLRTGLNATIVLLGLFSISQVYTLIGERLKMTAEERAAEKNKQLVALKGKDLTLKEKLHLLPTIVYTSIVGLFVGILPGAGASIGAFVGYNEAKRMSKHKEEFGKGSIEGIAGPEAANNAVTGGSMIPLMTLGIPGSPVAAILLGALMIHGLQPGYKLFTEEADITYPIIFGFLLANVAMYFVGKVFVRLLRRVVDIPPAILNACIVVLVAVGGYSISNSINDLYIAAIFGLVGYFCRIGKFNTSALTLGLVLGTITEKGLRRSITMARGDIIGYYLARPACIILIVLIVASLFGPAFKKLLTRVKTKRG